MADVLSQAEIDALLTAISDESSARVIPGFYHEAAKFMLETLRLREVGDVSSRELKNVGNADYDAIMAAGIENTIIEFEGSEFRFLIHRNDVASAGFSDVCAALASAVHAEPGSAITRTVSETDMQDFNWLEGIFFTFDIASDETFSFTVFATQQTIALLEPKQNADDRRRIKIYDFKRPDKFSASQIRTLAISHVPRLLSNGTTGRLRSYRNRSRNYILDSRSAFRRQR